MYMRKYAHMPCFYFPVFFSRQVLIIWSQICGLPASASQIFSPPPPAPFSSLFSLSSPLSLVIFYSFSCSLFFSSDLKPRISCMPVKCPATDLHPEPHCSIFKFLFNVPWYMLKIFSTNLSRACWFLHGICCHARFYVVRFHSLMIALNSYLLPIPASKATKIDDQVNKT